MARNKTKRKCSVENCDRPHNARGLCNIHYRAAQKRGDFGTKCAVNGCDGFCVGKGLCEKHYKQERVAGNREKVNAYMREYLSGWRKENETKEQRSARSERHRRANLAKFADKERARRARKRSNGGSFTIQEWEELKEKYNGMCAYCGNNPGTTADHVIPVAKGGSSFIENILPACISCNSSKQDKLIDEWRKCNG